MEKNKRLYAFLASFSMLIGAAAGAFIVAVMVLPDISVNPRYFFASIAAFVVFFALTIIFICKAVTNEKTKKTIVRVTMIVAFTVYLIMFFGFLFLIKAYSNHAGFLFSYNKEWLKNALPGMIPFKHTFMKIFETFKGTRNFSRTILELGGNIFAFVPFAFFLPAMFKSMRHFDSFLPMIVFITIATEIFQGMFGLGSCRIDDFLLGAGFACLAFYILRRPKIIKFFVEKHIYF